MDFFDQNIQKFFVSIAKYLQDSGDNSFSWLFIIFLGIFALTTIVVIFSTFFSYEFVLTRAIDKINKFLSKNPRINEDNLVAFNNKMKDHKIPKPLRRQWQQFMIYREHEASHYMSFKHCVENPLKTSTYHQQMSVYQRVSIILVCLSILIGVFCSYKVTFVDTMQDVLIIPIFILVLYWLISMILNLIHNATTADLYQNYQYFEINIDKATTTLPEYVDYEVLFTQDEIKRGIPVLFEYIQKRAIEEQKELERARIKNVEHEKFNFDDSGLDASLVLERSMKESEDYIATRKKYRQDIDQVNNEIAALDNQYKDNVKENQKLMQTSKESVDGLKKQLEQATSTIEINYIKKQMKDEINRQQVTERDFDAMTEKHNKEVKNLQEEISRLEGEIEKAKKTLEDSMMSEFGTYSTKVFKKVEDKINGEQKEIIEDYERRIRDLEERLSQKDEELENVYSQYQTELNEMEQKSKNFDNILKEKDDIISQVQGALDGKSKKKTKKNSDEGQAELENYNYDDNQLVDSGSMYEEAQTTTTDYDYSQDNDENYSYADDTNYTEQEQNNEEFNYQDDTNVNDENQDNESTENDSYNYYDISNSDETFNYQDDEEDDDSSANLVEKQDEETSEDFNYLPDEDAFEKYDKSLESDTEENSNDETLSFNYLDNDDNQNNQEVEEKEETEETTEDDKDSALDELFSKWFETDDESEKDDKETEEQSSEEKVEKPLTEEDANDADVETDSEGVKAKDEKVGKTSKRKAGRPKKGNKGAIDFNFLVNGETEEKVENTEEPTEVKEEVVPKKAGRPKKEESKEEIDFDFLVDGVEKKTRRGRPKKVETSAPIVVKRAGRPRKKENNSDAKTEANKRAGRPKKVAVDAVVKRNIERPKKEETAVSAKRAVGRPKKARPVGRPKKIRPVGRPKKNSNSSTKQGKNINEIDKKLKELDKQIQKENANIAKTKRQLAKAKIKKAPNKK